MNALAARLTELNQLVTPLTASEDFAAFWEASLEECRKKPLFATRKPIETLMLNTVAYEVTFRGFDETPLHGLYLLPDYKERKGKLPCVVVFHGYSGGKECAEHHAVWLMMGLAVLAVDVRGQGGTTGNLLPLLHGQSAGWVSQNILDRDTCYYKAIVLDAVRALDWAWEQPEIDSSCIAVFGESQGGGLALAATALSGKAAVTVSLIPNMCRMDYGVMHSTGSLSEVGRFASMFPEHLDRILNVLSYFDIVNLADRIQTPVLVSASLKDTVCWPDTVFAAYNRMNSANKEMLVDPFAGHYISRSSWRKSLQFIRDRLQFIHDLEGEIPS